MTDAVTQAQQYDPIREVRFATVMYGGVSLAIYINGVAQELFRLVRATAPLAAGSRPFLAEGELDGSEQVYREIGRRLQGDNDWRREDPGPDAPIVSRFVVDILSGTSAGGINAIFLAKALANGQDFSKLRELWIKEADINDLLNEPHAFKGVKTGSVKYEKPPQSLLAGPRLYDRARTTLAEMAADETASGEVPAGPRPQYAEQVDLAVTATDLQGLWLPIRLADGSVLEPRHRTVLRFVYATARATGQERNDFQQINDPTLAFAARATSSFPFAFEPVLPRDAVDGKASPEETLDPGFFADYVRAQVPWCDWAFADGGYLDNKPFTHATNTLRRRRADVPVDRRLLYIEPDPSRVPNDRDEPDERPDATRAVGAAIILPRVESIRDDITTLLERNETIERIRRVTRGVEIAAIRQRDAAEPPAPVELAYLRLRRLEVVEDLTALVLRVAGQPADGDEARFVSTLLDAWACDGGSDQADNETLRAFLEQYDLRFRLRQLALIHDRVVDLLLRRNSDVLLEAANATIDAGAAATDGAAWLLARNAALNSQVVELRTIGRQARARDQPPEQHSLAAAIARFGFGTDSVTKVVDTPNQLDAARTLLTQPELAEAVAAFEAALAAHFGGTIAAAAEEMRTELRRGAETEVERQLSALLVSYVDGTTLIDMATLPLVYPDLRETNPVEIFRVSPQDAESLVPTSTGKTRLAGAAVGHFGGFLDRRWRESDMLWGRLDGAERLISALVPLAEDRDDLRIRAQGEILRAELRKTPSLSELVHPTKREQLLNLAGSDSTTPHELVDWFSANYEGPPSLDEGAAMKLLGRSAAITGEVLDGAAEKNRALSKPLFWFARVARLVSGFAELLIPGGTRPRNVLRRWANLALLVGILLVAAGLFLGIDGAQPTGWAVVGATLGVVVTSWILRADFSKKRLILSGVVLAAVVLLLATFGVLVAIDRGLSEVTTQFGT